MNKIKLGVSALAAWMVAATAFGQGTVIPIKTPPLRSSLTQIGRQGSRLLSCPVRVGPAHG
jgi:hypothetical protein